MIETHGREGIQPFANYVEAPIGIEQPLTRSSGNLSAETEVLILFAANRWNRC